MFQGQTECSYIKQEILETFVTKAICLVIMIFSLIYLPMFLGTLFVLGLFIVCLFTESFLEYATFLE